MPRPYEVFNRYLRSKNLKLTHQRQEILKAFLSTEKHVTTDEFYDIVRKKSPRIGHATVFRTLKLLCEADIAKALNLGDKRVRYEPKYGQRHHDHLICSKCGTFIEAFDQEIEKLQDKLCKRFGFKPRSHRLEIFGVCKECKK